MMRTIRQSVRVVGQHVGEDTLQLDVNTFPISLSERAAAALGIRAQADIGQRIYLKYLANYQGNDPVIWEFCQRAATQLLFYDTANWETYLSAIERSYKEGLASEALGLQGYARSSDTLALPVARAIAEHPDKYPGQLVTIAESVCRSDVAARITPVGLIAQRDGWFR
ncbi:MAG: hypothetical protein FJZ89_05735 [Chloroflexi bacterium]|nr:hypothetical protein [Chloroflexota bacterium]